MSMNFSRSMFAMFVVLLFCSCQRTLVDTVSPDGNLKVTVIPAEKEGFGEVLFAVDYKGKPALPLSRLGVETDLRRFTDNMKLKSTSDVKEVTDDYTMLTGKRSHCVNRAKERTYYLENEDGNTLEVTFRVYGDGVAIKYRLDSVAGNEKFLNEYTAYTVPNGSKRWMIEYRTGYEWFYPLSTDGRLADNPGANLWGYPALVELQDSLFMLITEAGIRRGDCGSRLYNGEDADRYCVRMADEEIPFCGSWDTPWRLLIIGSLSDVVESTLVTDVSEPSIVEDTEWIKPGTVAWNYWANNHGSKDFQIVKSYIDLAVNMKWPYHLIDWEWDVMANGGNIEDALKYAADKGVKSLMWYNSSTEWLGPGPLFRLNKKEDREKEYAWLNKIGVSGIKIDFFADDNVSTMNYYIDLLEDAAKYKLMINFHGATIPRGWQRTYPFMMSMESVYGAEWYNNAPTLTDRAAGHNATLPFTRNVIGPMDYTPGTFSDSQHPHITSHAHELALPVIFESSMQHMPDRPESYYSLPEEVKQFLSGLPTAWDDTRLLAGYPGDEVVMARRKGDVWYIAGINGTNEPRKLHFSLKALTVAGKSALLFSDGSDAKSFTIQKDVKTADENEMMDVECLPRGGFVMVIK